MALPVPDRNALAAFVARSVPVGRAAPRAASTDDAGLVVVGPLLLAAAGIAAMLLPSPESVAHGWVVLIAKSELADLDAVLKSSANALLIAAAVTFAAGLVLMALEFEEAVIVGGLATVVGGGALVAIGVAVLGMLLSVGVWIALGCLALWVLGALAD